MPKIQLTLTIDAAERRGRPFGELGTRLQLERTRVLESPVATHIKFRA